MLWLVVVLLINSNTPAAFSQCKSFIVVPFTQNERVLEAAGVERDLLNLIKRRKLSDFGHVMRKEGDCLE